MLTVLLERSALHHLTRDGWLLFLTRSARLFAYGSLSVVLVLYLTSLGLSGSQTGPLLTLTLAGDTLISLWLKTRADRIGRRRVLRIGALLMAAAGLAFASTGNLLLLIVAGTIQVISPSGNEVGPFLSIEQAALSHVVPNRMRTAVFAWYTVAGAFATATGSLFAGGPNENIKVDQMKLTNAPGHSIRGDNEYKRNGTAHIFAVVEPKAGRHFTRAIPDRSGLQFALLVGISSQLIHLPEPFIL